MTLDDMFDAGSVHLEGLVVAMTGAVGGIGSALIESLHRAGSTVAAFDIDSSRLDAVATEYETRVGTFPLDVTDDRAVFAAVDAVTECYGTIDVLVNGAGVIHADHLLDLAPSTWRKIFAVNVEGAFSMSQAVARSMLQHGLVRDGRRGLILNISSRAATIGRPVSAAYGASKAALDHLTMSFATALERDGIGCVSVHPGDVREGMLSYLLPAVATLEARTLEDVVAERTYQSPNEFASTLLDIMRVPGLMLSGSCVHANRSITRLEREA